MTVPLWSRTWTHTPVGGTDPVSRRGQKGSFWQITYSVTGPTALWSCVSTCENRYERSDV